MKIENMDDFKKSLAATIKYLCLPVINEVDENMAPLKRAILPP